MPGGVESGAFSGCVLLFCSEDDLNFFCANRIAGGASWHNAGEPAEADAADPAGEAEGTEQSGETEATEPSGEAVAASADYAIAFVDEAGNPVAGVVANVCDDVSCTVVTSDAGGRASFSLPSYATTCTSFRSRRATPCPAKAMSCPPRAAKSPSPSPLSRGV